MEPFSEQMQSLHSNSSPFCSIEYNILEVSRLENNRVESLGNNQENFKKALDSAITKAPIRSGNRIYLTDLWIITSIPEEIIVELLTTNNFRLPEEAVAIVDDRRKHKRVLCETSHQGGDK